MRKAGFHPGPIMGNNDIVLMKSRFDDARPLRNKQI